MNPTKIPVNDRILNISPDSKDVESVHYKCTASMEMNKTADCAITFTMLIQPEDLSNFTCLIVYSKVPAFPSLELQSNKNTIFTHTQILFPKCTMCIR